MKGTMKRIVSILLAVALVVTSLQYTPKTVYAADYTQLEYADITNNANNEFSASLKGSQIAVYSGPVTLNVKQYQNAGFSELYLACGGVSGANFSATINGQSVEVEGTGIRMYNAATYLTYEYNVLEVYDNNGDSIVVIYCPANEGKGTYEITGEKPTPAETTTNAGSSFVDGAELLKDTAFVDGSVTNWNEYGGNYINHGDNSVSVSVEAKTGGDNWSTQLTQNQITLTEGKWYVASVTITSDVARSFQLIIQSDGNNGGNWSVINSADNNGIFAVEAGVPYTYTVKFQANGVVNKYLYGVMMGYVVAPSAAANVTISNVSLKGYDNEPTTTPEETTTSAPVSGDSPIASLDELEDAYIYNYVESNGGFKAVFEDPNEDTVDEAVAELEEGATYTYKYYITVNGTTYEVAESGETLNLAGLTEGVEYDAAMYSEFVYDGIVVTSPKVTSKFVYKTTKTTVKNTGLAQIHFTSTGGKDSAFAGFYNGGENNKPKIPAVITVINADGTVDKVDFGTANIRGNSTANAAKKPYNFKFDSKLDVQGMGKAKKWSLLANLFDKTLMRNQIGMDFQRALEESRGIDQVYTSEIQPVDLYIDGEYAGTYSLVESVEVGGTRVDIDIDGIDEDTNEIIDPSKATTVTIGDTSYTVYDVLLELGNDNRLDDEAYYFQGAMEGGPANGPQQWAINEPAVGDDSKYDYVPTSTNKPEFVNLTQAYIKAFDNALIANDYNTFSQFMDVDSFVDFYITSEYFMTKDIAFSSTRFYIKEGKIYAGPLWDLDLSSGNNGSNLSAENFYAQNFKWFSYLMQNETFVAKVKERYTELQPLIKAIYATGGKVDQAYNTVVASANANYTEAYNTKWNPANPSNSGWGYGYIYGNGGFFNQLEQKLTLDQAYNWYGVYGGVDAYDNYEDYVTNYKTWLKDRNEWLIEQWDIQLTSGLSKNSQGDVVVTWDAVEGATGYAITYTPAIVAQAASLSLFNMAPIAAPTIVYAVPGEATTIYVPDGTVTSYNFTANGIQLANNTTVTVAYTTDATVDSTATYAEIQVDEAVSDIALLNRVTVDGLNATIVTNVTNNGTATAENVVLTLKDASGNEIGTQTVDAIAAGTTSTVTWNREETAGSYTYTVVTGLLSSGVAYTCNKPEDVVYGEDANLTAKREGATYAELGKVPETNFRFTEEGYFIETGAADQAIYIRLNGVVKSSNESGNSAMNYTVKYTDLEYGTTNVIQIEYVDRASDMVTMTTRIQTVYVKIAERPEETAPDLSTVIANTPDVTGTDGWMQATAQGGAAINNTKTLSYYIASSYYVGGANNNGFFNGNIYGYFGSGESVPYGGFGDNTVKGEAFALASELIRVGVDSVWISDGTNSEKLTDKTADLYWNPVNTDVLTFTASRFTLAQGETEKVYYVTVRTIDGTDYSWPIKIEARDADAVDISAWVAIPVSGPQAGTVEGKYYINEAGYQAYVNAAIYGVYAPASATAYHGGDCLLTGNAIAFANKSTDAMTSIVVDGVEYAAGTDKFHARGDSCEMALELFGPDDDNIHYVTVKGATDIAFAIKYEPEQEPADIADPTEWVEFYSSLAANGNTFYVSQDAITAGYVQNREDQMGCYNAPIRAPYNNAIAADANTLSWISAVGAGTWKSVWVRDSAGITRYTSDGINASFAADCMHVNQNAFALAAGETEKIFTITVRGTADYTFKIKVVSDGTEEPSSEESSTVEETTPPQTSGVIVPVGEPADAVWVEVQGSNGEYYYYIPTESTNYFAAIENRMENIYFAFKEIAAPFDVVTLNGTEITKSNGGFVEVQKEIMEPGAYQLQVTDFYGTQTVSLWIKKNKISNYTPTGLATSIVDGILTVNWVTSADADIDGCLYTVTVDGEATDVTDMASVKTATFDFTGKAYGNYEVVLTTKTPDGTVVNTQTVTVRYKDPEAIESTVTYRARWEAKRHLIVNWTTVENATGYAVYVDGKLYDTTTDLTYTIPAYAFANNVNEFDQPTTVGAHSVSLVALFDNAEALENEADVNSKHVMDTYTADILVNYMYGNLTNIWNVTGIDSVWNFTVSEIPKSDIKEGADVKVEYNDDGSADVNIIYTGRHSSYVDQNTVGDQAWTIKAAIYDQPITKGELLNLSFDITGPAYLVGQRIQIKCVPEEVDDNENYYSVPEYGYEEALYTFEPVYAEDGVTVEYAVLHYTNSFETTNDTYDLLFGLGLLYGAEEGGSIDINLSDPNVKKVYGVTSVTATGIPNVDDATNNSGYISWTTNVPTHLSSEYTYDLVIKDKDGKIVSVKDADGNVLSTFDENGNVLISVPNATNNSTYYGFAEGTYTVEVSSVYDNSITATESTEMVIEIPETDHPDLIITEISIPEGEYRVGDTVPVSITMTNIGTADATPAAGNLAVHLHVKDTTSGEKGYYTVPGNTIPVGGSITQVINYTITAGDSDGNDLFTIIAEADSDAVVAESNETNNVHSVVHRFLPALQVVTLTNDGTDISATWPDAGEGTKYIIEYKVNGETKQVEVDTNSYVFPAEDVMANNTEVNVYIASDDGSSALYAEGVALADLIIETIVPENGFAYVGQANNLLATVKNIGTASAIANEGQEQNVSVAFTSTGVFTNYGSYYEVIAPNASGVVTIPGYTPTTAGNVELSAVTDDINRITESDETNNTATVDVYAVEEGAVELSLDDTDSDNPFVKVSWENPEGVTADENSKYMIKYVVDGVEITDYIQNPDGYTEENQVVFVETDADGNTRYYVKNYAKLDNQSEVFVYLVVEGTDETIPCGVDTAMVDLVISAITVVSESEDVNTAYMDDEFSIVLSVKNQGTAKVAESSDEVLEDGTIVDYGKWIINQMTLQNNITVPGDGLVSTNTGLYAGETKEFRYDGVVANAVGTYNIPFKTDSPGWEAVNVAGFIPESNEDNNTATLELNVVDPPFEQEKMDWTLFTSQQVMEDGTPYVIINNGSDQKPVEFKVLDTSITDLHYYDIYTKVDGYAGQYIAFGINGEAPMVKSDSTGVTSELYFAQVSSHTTDIYDYETMDSTINYGEARTVGDGLLQTWDGNGFQLHTRSFAAGKYYIVKIVNSDGTYLTLGLRIPGDLGNWILAKASDDSDPFKVPVVYHDKNHTVNGAVYYDGSDLGLAGISVYNGNHLALTTDGTMKLNSNKWKMTIAYASVDENGNFVEKIADDLLEEIGYDPGTIELLPTDEIFGEQGANTILIKMPELMWELPIHSPLGGEWDSEYYILRVYPDTENRPDDFIYLPLNIRGEIPMIEGVNGLTVAGRGDTLSVMWTNSITQDVDGYLYDVYIDKNHDGDYDDDGELVSVDVPAGSYNYTEGIDVANSSGYSAKVVAKWCQQKSPAEVDYVVGGDQEKETLPGEEETYPTDDNEHKWVLISGENTLPVTDGTSEEDNATTKGQIWYYTDDDMYSVVGYNGHYISLNGNTTYFTGTDSMLFVQDGPTDETFESKIIHDNFYDGQILINAANMFTTYEDTDGDGVLYYTVKITGENGNTEKNFYFKVVLNPTDESISATGDWRYISGQKTLPVLFNGYELQGTVEYYDYPTLTNTYDMTGYNDYFISVVGNTENYSGRTTQLFVSTLPMDEESDVVDKSGETPVLVTNADTEYSSKEIYDQVYRGQIQMRCSTTFTVAYTTTYYMMKIVGVSATDGTETVTYVPVRITVYTGDVEVQGFQMNTDNSETGIARYNPSLRVVSRASNVMTIGNELHEVLNYGTIYAIDENVSGNGYADMKITSEDAEDYNPNVYHFEATKDVGTLNSWTSANGDEKYNKYYALSFEFEFYTFTSLTTELTFRAYAVLDDGTIVYGNNVYTVTMEEVAEHLYNNKKMGTIAGHNFLYDNVLNIVAIDKNRKYIAQALMAATDVDEATDENYPLVNQTYKDMNNYVYCVYGYTYSGRKEFACSTEENEQALLAIIDPDNEYGSVSNWIYANVEEGKGFYKRVEYSWDNSIDKEFDSE